jgi:hypothetical protein
VRELASGHFIGQAENVLIFGPPGVGKTHLAIALGRAAVETGHSVPFYERHGAAGGARKAETDDQLAERLTDYTKPKLLIIHELGYLRFERRSAHFFFQLVARRYERGSLLITTISSSRSGGTVFGDEARRRDPRPAAAPHADDPRRQLSIETEEEGRPARTHAGSPHVTAVTTRGTRLMAYSVGARRHAGSRCKEKRHLRPILRRSLYRPRASTEGSRTENSNRSRARLWFSVATHGNATPRWHPGTLRA